MAVNEAADIFAMSAQPRRAVSPFGRLDMVVDITVAEVTEGQGADAGESRGETARIFGDEARHQVDRDGDALLKRRPHGPLSLRAIGKAPVRGRGGKHVEVWADG